MFLAKFRIVGASDLMFGKHVSEPKRDDETHDQFESRSWRGKVSVLPSGQCYIQPFALKNCLESASKWLGMKIPGEGKKTFTKRFASGILVVDKILLEHNGRPVTIDDVEPLKIFAPSDGQRGSGKRVFRVFPTLHDWEGSAVVNVFDNKITSDVFSRHITAAGKFIGLGSMRVENGGINGRFRVEDFEYSELGEEEAA